MPLPVGVETRTIRLTVPMDTLGNPPKVYAGTVQPDRTIVWGDTGDRLWPAGAQLPAVVGGEILFDVPIVDQDGWIDRNGVPITNWAYKLVVRATWDVTQRAETRTFQVVEASPDPVDIELLPSGATLPVELGDPYVVSLGGISGAITTEMLVDLLEGAGIEGMPSFYHPVRDYGAAGDGSDDSTELLNCWEDVADLGGGVIIVDRPYGFDVPLPHLGGVMVWQTIAQKLLAVPVGLEPGLIALGDEAQYLYGLTGDGSGSANDNPGPIKGLVVDGAGIAGAEGLFVMDCAQSSTYDLGVIGSIGPGLHVGRSQNTNHYNPQIGSNATGVLLKPLVAGQQGPGHNIFHGGHIHDNELSVHVTSHSGADFFFPHDNVFKGTIVETGRVVGQPVQAAAILESGQTQFDDVNFTFGAQVGGGTGNDVVEDCLILVDNPHFTVYPTVLQVRGGSIGGGANGVTDAVRVMQSGAFNDVHLTDGVGIANVDYVLCMDGSVLGAGSDLTGAIEPVRIVAGTPEMFREINAGSVAGLLETRYTPMRHVVPNDAGGVNPITANPFQTRRLGDVANRMQVDRDGGIRHLNAATGATVASIINAGAGYLISGENAVQIVAFTTAGRPAAANALYLRKLILDTDLGILLWSDGVNWRAVADATAAGAIPLSYLDTTGTLAANSDAKVASQKATKTYVDTSVGAVIAAADAMVFKGVIDCSANPNYPAADRGWTYRVSVAGKIGGAAGPNVEIGDLLFCLTDGTAAGNHATVGASWSIGQTNVDGAVVGPAGAPADNDFVQWDGVTGRLVKTSGYQRDTDGTLAANSDAKLASQKAVKTYVDARTAAITEYTAVQTNTVYAIPTGAKTLDIEVQGGGGSGGTGKRGANGAARCGGGAGGGGGRTTRTVNVADLTALGVTQLYVTVGAGGGSTAGQGVDDTNGNGGTGGNVSAVRTTNANTNASTICNASGGNAGVGGNNANGTGGTGGGSATYAGGAGAAAGAAGVLGSNPAVAVGAAPGGGGGGGLTAANAQSAGGAGGVSGGGYGSAPVAGTAGGGAGTSAVAGPVLMSGQGGAGGGSNAAGVGGAGGNGVSGGGGGGSGASPNGSASGASGAGGDGYVKIVAWF